MGKRKELIKELRDWSDPIVIKRDKGKCFICGAEANSIHEIVPRSHFGTKTLKICFDPKNRCCLCAHHHEEVQGNKNWAKLLLLTLQSTPGYVYEEPSFSHTYK